MRNVFRVTLSVVLSLVILKASQADVIYDNNAGGAVGSDGRATSDLDFNFVRADDVTLPSTTDVTGIQWTGSYNGTGNLSGIVPPDDFTISVYADAGGSPQTSAALAFFDVGNSVNRTDTGLLVGGAFPGARVFSFEADINFTFDAGVRYWVSIAGDTSSTPTSDFFEWHGLNDQGNSFSTNNGAASWVARDIRLDFRLTAVPEPTSLGLLVLASFGLASVRMRT